MENEEKIKQVWQTPEVIDLDIEKTKGGSVPFLSETTTLGLLS